MSPADATAPYYHPDFRGNPDDPLQQDLDRLYDYAGDLETRLLHRGRLNLFHQLMGELAAAGVLARRGTALDIGCNAGAYSRMIADAGYADVLGIDIEPHMIAAATARFASESPGRALRFRVENAERLDTSRRCDFVLCTEVIEHTAHPEAVVANLKAVLAPGGIAMVTMPNACSLPFMKAALKHRLARRPRDPVFEDHLKYPFWKALALFEGPDLERVRISGTNLWWDATSLKLLHRTPLFEPLHRAQFAIARRWPACCVAQFFCMVWRKRG